MKTYKFTKWNGETGEVFECPFCGGKPKVIYKGNSYTKRRKHLEKLKRKIIEELNEKRN